MNRVSFASLAYDRKKKKTRREKFLEEMDQVIPWVELLAVIKKYYPKAGNGRQPMPMEQMLRIYLMQQWYGLSDPAMEDALYDSESMRRFADTDLASDAIPDETTILSFCRLLEKHRFTEKIFERTHQYLQDKGLLLREGTIVDATIIIAPSSTKTPNRFERSGNVPDKEGDRMVFRDEGSCGDGYEARFGTPDRSHGCCSA